MMLKSGFFGGNQPSLFKIADYQKMKNLSLAVTVVSLVVNAGSAFAQSFAYTPGDVILGFRTSPVSTDIVIDLGSLTSITSLAPGGTYQVADITTPLSIAYGDTTVPSGKILAIFSATQASTEVYLSNPRSSSSTSSSMPADGTSFKAGSTTSQKVLATAVNQVGLSAKTLSSTPGFGPTSDSTYVVMPSIGANQNGYTSVLKPTSTSWFGTKLARSVQNNRLLEGTTTSGGLSLDFFHTTSANATLNGAYLGYFTISHAGIVSFTPVTAVPEPQEYAAVFGLGLAGFALWRRNSSK